MTKLSYLFIICAFSLAIFSSCEKDVKVSGIIVEPKNLYLSKGDVAQLAYMVTPYSADNKSVRWESKDISIATVSETGLVTAISEGETQIVATTNDGHFSAVVSAIVARGSPAGDSIALVKLHEVARYLPAWDFTKPMNTWEGVGLNANRRVLYINYGNTIYLSKPLDASIGNLNCLQSLSLAVYYNANAIIIPPEIGKLTDLQYLYLNDGFTGSIPPELGNLTQLETIRIEDNSLTSSIPKELGNLTNLTLLVLSNCQLTGNIPQELGKLTNLTALTLIENQLSGNIPKELGNLSNLTGLYLRHNQLTGEIPKELGNLTKLEELSVRFNQLTGEIPKELGSLTNLRLLYLQNNQLSGAIPQELGNLNNLYDLDLTYNSLSGTIPQSLLDRFGYWNFCPQNGTMFDNFDCGRY